VAFTVIIPARLGSQRLPGKVLLDIAGKPMIQRVYEQASLSDAASVLVATDDERVAEVVRTFGGRVCMTAASHVSGTDRLQEVAAREGLAADALVVNVQGDEPLMPAAVINQLAQNLATSNAAMATLYETTSDLNDILDPNVVKVVTDAEQRALYFSRAPIPWARDDFSAQPPRLPAGVTYKRHLGIYGYRVELLHRFVAWPPAPLELVEKLEQLRVLWHGESIHIEAACEAIPPGIDTEQDLARVRALFL
jgi:3-deoxy-manno-octulosonate cytidylyltransferase (CMP-KDO synthetase)